MVYCLEGLLKIILLPGTPLFRVNEVRGSLVVKHAFRRRLHLETQEEFMREEEILRRLLLQRAQVAQGIDALYVAGSADAVVYSYCFHPRDQWQHPILLHIQATLPFLIPLILKTSQEVQGHWFAGGIFSQRSYRDGYSFGFLDYVVPKPLYQGGVSAYATAVQENGEVPQLAAILGVMHHVPDAAPPRGERSEVLVFPGHHAQDGSQLRDLTILLDCRCVRGDATLVERLWDYIIEETERIPVSVRSLGEDATGKPVPLNFLGRLQYERDQEGKRGLNVKKYGMLPLIAGVKAIAVDHGIRATSNVERINALGDLGALEKESAEDLLFAHEFFLRLKVQASAERVFHDQASTHFIYPEEWSSWEKDNLKKAFKAVDHLQTILRYHFVL